mmetsp:Transcript_60370/g.176453  ORF Transcript_60370/g.176453 Transcript_60370/m.176453 type:complete len:238 (-) Transcript_60370:1178-1891(-)
MVLLLLLALLLPLPLLLMLLLAQLRSLILVLQPLLPTLVLLLGLPGLPRHCHLLRVAWTLQVHLASLARGLLPLLSLLPVRARHCMLMGQPMLLGGFMPLFGLWWRIALGKPRRLLLQLLLHLLLVLPLGGNLWLLLLDLLLLLLLRQRLRPVLLPDLLHLIVQLPSSFACTCIDIGPWLRCFCSRRACCTPLLQPSIKLPEFLLAPWSRAVVWVHSHLFLAPRRVLCLGSVSTISW